MQPKQSAKFDFKSECDFRDLRRSRASEIEAACKYEYMRESQALRDELNERRKPSITPYLARLSRSCMADCPARLCTADRPKQYEIQKRGTSKAPEYRIYCSHCKSAVNLPPLPGDHWIRQFATATNQKYRPPRPVLPSFAYENLSSSERYHLVYALLKAGFPKPWNQLIKNSRKKLVQAISEWETEGKKSHPPVVLEAASREPDEELNYDPDKPHDRIYWRLEPSEPELLRGCEQSDRKYFFAFVRIDKAYNETEAAKAFKEWFRERWGKTKGGNRERWGAQLKNLVVMRLWKRFPRREYRELYKRLNLVAQFCGYKGCVKEAAEYKERCEEGRGDEPISKAAEVEMSRARSEARTFFQSLFPGEEPLSW